MNKDEIKRLIDGCIDPCIDKEFCEKCKYYGYNCCQDYLCRDALAVIDEQEKDYSKLQEEFASYQLASDKEIRAQVKQAKVDVLKRLKVFSEPYPNSWGIYVIDVYHIDELIKEIEK